MSKKRRQYKRAILLSFLSIAIMSISLLHAQQTEDKNAGLKVTFLIYSGRSNPSLVIENLDQINKIRNIIDKTEVNKTFREKTVLLSILGYNGIVIENRSKIPGLPPFLAVYGENIELNYDQIQFRKDKEEALENYLLNRGIENKVIDRDLLKSVSPKIGTWPTPE